MIQFLLPLLAALGSAGGSAATGAALGAGAGAGALGAGALGAGALGAGALGAAALPAVASAAIPAAATTAATTAAPGFIASMFPNLAQFGTSVMGGDIAGAGGALGNMVGGKTLGSMISQPSMANLKTLAGPIGDKMATNVMMQGLFGSPQQPMTTPEMAPQGPPPLPMPETDDPILRRMYSNLNPQTRGMYPGRMSRF